MGLFTKRVGVHAVPADGRQHLRVIKKAAHMSAQAEKETLEPLELALRFCRSPHRRKQEPLATSRINARKDFKTETM
ncbi:hypothetical protein C1M53_16010 [Mesorhizobium sp. Pch-S]|nr:hypothetical protein C1M53_16010 [Mesorhizobium sp. Pch-S]